ncbi:MAG: caspase family protein [bacterium]|nr:caspase family protein [bacterium]
MTKHAVCIGINDYTGTANDLRGCVNDAEDWAALLSSQYSFETALMLDDQATHDGVLGALADLVDSTGPGDLAAFTYSGHGTWVFDQGEPDESDNRDEALAVFDGNIIDDEMRAVLTGVHPEASLSIICDSCHSGGVTRAALANALSHARTAEVLNPPVPRFLPPEDDVDALAAFMLPVRKRAFYPESSMNHVLLTGCNALEYSYDAFFNGRNNGAMSFFTTQLIYTNPQQTWAELHAALRRLLPSTQYPQSPQLEGTDGYKSRPIFT